MKSLGQNFLQDEGVLKKIALRLGILPNETVVEIGPGHGELTRHLLLQKPKRLVAIEKDRRLVPELKKISEIEVVEGDALIDLRSIARKIKGPYKIAGNIPYYITGHLLRILGELPQKPSLVILVVQKEVAERAVAEPPRMNRLAASVRFWAEPKILGIIPAGSFRPVPKVDSAILYLAARKKTGDPDSYFPMMRAIFQQPRKTILNNLANSPLFKRKGAASELLLNLGIDPKSRPQDLSIELIERLGENAVSGD